MAKTAGVFARTGGVEQRAQFAAGPRGGFAMKRGWRLLWVGMAVLFLLLFPHHCVSQHPPQSAGDSSSLGPSKFICRTPLAASPSFSQSRASLVEMFTIYSELLITDDVGPPWLDHRGPPGARACSRSWARCKAASQTGSVREHRSSKNSQCTAEKTNGRFSTSFS
jgi:hypothetical protein